MNLIILKPESIVAPLLLGQLVLSEHGEVNGVEELQLGAAVENRLEKPIKNFATAGLTSFVLKLSNFEIENEKNKHIWQFDNDNHFQLHLFVPDKAMNILKKT